MLLSSTSKSSTGETDLDLSFRYTTFWPWHHSSNLFDERAILSESQIFYPSDHQEGEDVQRRCFRAFFLAEQILGGE